MDHEFETSDDIHHIGVSAVDFKKAFGDTPTLNVTQLAQTLLSTRSTHSLIDPATGGFRQFRRPIWLLFVLRATYMEGVDPLSEGGSNKFVKNPAFRGEQEEDDLSPSGFLFSQLQKNRLIYKQLVQKFEKKKTNRPTFAHPLSQPLCNQCEETDSDDDLAAEIRKDVERTYPERALFNSEATRKSLQRILFTWCKANPDVSYKQGMNELLGVLYMCCYRDQSEEGLIFFESETIEADCYVLFACVMGYLGGGSMFFVGRGTSGLSPVLARCNYVYHVLLRKANLSLYNHLSALEIEPQLFLLRWIRLLFSREFHIDDVLVIWDALLADAYIHRIHSTIMGGGNIGGDNKFLAETNFLGEKHSLGGKNIVKTNMGGLPNPNAATAKEISKYTSSRIPLVDFFAVAMLKFVKANLLQQDMTGCLKRLLKFPPLESVVPLIKVALAERSKHESAQGENLFSENSPMGVDNKYAKNSRRDSSMKNGYSPELAKSSVSSPTTQPVKIIDTSSEKKGSSINPEQNSIKIPPNNTYKIMPQTVFEEDDLPSVQTIKPQHKFIQTKNPQNTDGNPPFLSDKQYANNSTTPPGSTNLHTLLSGLQQKIENELKNSDRDLEKLCQQMLKDLIEIQNTHAPQEEPHQTLLTKM